MCNQFCHDFVKRAMHCFPPMPDVLEVGSLNVNGTPRDIIDLTKCSSYVGADLQDGPGVDVVCNVFDLDTCFKAADWDVVLSTEMLEHVPDWRLALYMLARRLRPGGVLVLTTRSPGFEFHEYPEDHWRFTRQDMERIFQPDTWDWIDYQDDPDLRCGKPSGLGIVLRLRNQVTSQKLWSWAKLMSLVEVMHV